MTSVGSRMVDVVGARLAVYDGSVSDHPVLLFGQHDIYGETTTRLTGRVRHARAVTLVGAGHSPRLQNQTAFSSEVRSFFTASHSQVVAPAMVGGSATHEVPHTLDS